jgi:Tol biopolymer transport system component
MPTCANCHSFSAEGKTFGMDIDGPANDKGLYAVVPVQKHMSIQSKDMVHWNTDGRAGQTRVGFMSQVSPDGRYVVSTFAGPMYKLLQSYYVTNFTDYRFLQVFYPTRGILEWYSRSTGLRQPLPGADDPKYAQTDGVWSPDGKYIVFARAEARPPRVQGQPQALYANDPNETQIQYDLYRIPFNDGKGGTPERIVGASQNGMSNNFPKVSPDGRWIVFVQCRNGQLMRPDSQLYIVPFTGGVARRLRANTSLMNSWHSFSPNGRWLVFSSKSRSPYTQMYLTHIDANGNSSPAILIDNATAANRAVNIPEFVHMDGDGIEDIEVHVADAPR